MSSSKILKPRDLNDSKVCNVNYEMLMSSSFPAEGETKAYLESEGFTPLFFNDGVGLHDGKERLAQHGNDFEKESESLPAEEPSEPPEGMQLIEEQELQRLLSESYVRGLEEGRLAAERGLANVFKALREGTEGLALLRDKILRESETDLLKLAIMIAQKITLQELKQDPQILANIVATALSCCSEKEKIIIRLNPDDYRMVTGSQQFSQGLKLDSGRISLAPDDSIRLGGCTVETPTGTVDSTIETQLDEVLNRCLEERGIPREPSIRLNDEG